MHPETPSDPEKRFIPWRGGQLAYTQEGAGPAMVAIPGLPGTIRDFRWLAPAMSSDFRLLRVELPGFGESTRGGYRGMSIAERAEPVVALIEREELGPVVLVGHSSGGTVVAHIATARPDLVRACVFLAVPGARPHYPLRTYRALAAVLRRRAGRRATRGFMRWLYRTIGFPAYLSDDERCFTSLDAAATEFADHAHNVAHIPVPLLIAWACDDRLIPTDIYEELASLAPRGPRLRFQTGGHNIQKTQAVEIAEAVRDMLDNSAAR